MRSLFVLIVAFAFIGCALSAAIGVDSVPKSLDAVPLNANLERQNDQLAVAEDVQPEAGETDSSRSKRTLFFPRYYHYYGWPAYGVYYPRYGYYYYY